ncbi:MAG: FAD-dependent oxidoreductase, partial [Gammaproteobacteria bacterium]
CKPSRSRRAVALPGGVESRMSSPNNRIFCNARVKWDYDALALGNALHAVVSGAHDAAALEEYERSRRPIAQRVVELTDRMTRVATLSGRQKRALRNFMIRVLDHIPAFRRSLAMDLAELHNR